MIKLTIKALVKGKSLLIEHNSLLNEQFFYDLQKCYILNINHIDSIF